jgi:hypothetical protein
MEIVTKTLHTGSGEADGREINGISPPECLAQIDRLVSNPYLQGSEALCKLLQYLAHHTLNSPAGHLKEYQIATEVLGRPANFDPQSDASVRVQVGRLRAKLAEYYNSAGSADPLVVDVPKGRYTLSFERRGPAPKEKASGISIDRFPESRPGQRRWMLAELIVIVLAVGCCAALWVQNRDLSRSLHPWRDTPAIAALWSRFLDTNQNTDIVMEDSGFLLVQNFSKQTFSFNDYLNRTYLNRFQAQAFSPEMLNALNVIAGKTLARSSQVRLVQRILALDPLGKKVHLYNAREYLPSLATQDNLILFGNPTSNPWEELFQSHLNFTEIDSTELSPVTNRAPAAGEQAIYTPMDNTIQYCVVAYLANPAGSGNILLVQGTSSEATEAGGDFLLSEDQLSNFMKKLHATRLPYFEVLLKISQVTGTPLTTTIEAYRAYPDPH